MDEEQGDWYCTVEMGIDEVRMLYSHVCYSLEMWPGSPARPAEEQEYLRILKMRLFSMISDYSFYNIEKQ